MSGLRVCGSYSLQEMEMDHFWGAWALTFSPCSYSTDILLGSLKGLAFPKAHRPFGHHLHIQAAESRNEDSVSTREQARVVLGSTLLRQVSSVIPQGVISISSYSQVTTALLLVTAQFKRSLDRCRLMVVFF